MNLLKLARVKSAPVKAAIIAGLLLGAGMAQPAMAQGASTGTLVPGLAVANLDAVIQNSAAFKAAETQRPVTYKAQLDQAERRRGQLEAQIKPLIDRFNADSKAANPNQASLAQQAQQIQKMQQAGQEELNQILRPFAYSQAYVQEQIENMLEQAIKRAMTKKRISLVLNPEAIVAVNDNAYNLNQDILNELNVLLPAAQLVPPADWEPRQLREAKARQAAQQEGAGAPAAAPVAGSRPTGR
jgi:Skp family chaperone for outer membrane proteins